MLLSSHVWNSLKKTDLEVILRGGWNFVVSRGGWLSWELCFEKVVELLS